MILIEHDSFKIFPIDMLSRKEKEEYSFSFFFFFLRFVGTIHSSLIRAGMYRRKIIEYFDSFEFFQRVFHEVVSRLTVPLLNSTLSTKPSRVRDSLTGNIDSSTRFFARTRNICAACKLFTRTFRFDFGDWIPVHNSTGVELKLIIRR